MRGWPGKTHPKTPTELSSSIFQCNFLGWSRKNFTAESQKFRCIKILNSKWYILILKSGHGIGLMLPTCWGVPLPSVKCKVSLHHSSFTDASQGGMQPINDFTCHYNKLFFLLREGLKKYKKVIIITFALTPQTLK